MNYVTLSEVTDYLGLESATDDGLLSSLIESSQTWIDGYTGRTFEAAADSTRVFTFEAIEGRRLFLDADLCAITSVTNGNGVVIAGSSYVTNPRNVKPWYALELKSSATVAWDGLTGDISIVGRWAYSTTAPADIRQACLDIVVYQYRKRDNASESNRTIVVGNSTILPSQLSSQVIATLDRYKVRI